MQKILMTFTNVSWQKGSAAQVFSFVTEMRKLDRDLEFVLLSHCYDVDIKPASDLGINLTNFHINPAESSTRRSLRIFFIQLKIILWALLKKLHIDARRLVRNPIAAAYLEADLIADLSGDSYRDRPGGVSVAHNVNLLAAISAKKPVVLVSQSVGPFKWYSRHLTRFALNKAVLIYIREKRSLAILKELKVKSRIAIAPDVAFVLQKYDKEKLLDICSQEGISKGERKKKLVGISTSNLLHYLAQKQRIYDYMLTMVEFIEYVHTSCDATVILIPHEIKPACMGIDDRLISYQLAERLDNPLWLKVIKFDHDPSEIKTLISSLDAFIAARMHAGIAALSSNVPTIFLSWSHKYVGLLEEMNIPEFVWDGNTENIASLKRLFDRLMKDRESIKKVLADYNSLAEESIKSQLNAILRIARLKKTLHEQAA